MQVPAARIAVVVTVITQPVVVLLLTVASVLPMSAGVLLTCGLTMT